MVSQKIVALAPEEELDLAEADRALLPGALLALDDFEPELADVHRAREAELGLLEVARRRSTEPRLPVFSCAS